MSTREDLQKAFLACRRSHGIKEAMAIVAKFAANNETDLDAIPSAKWDAAIAALMKDVPADDGDGETATSASAPAAPKKTLDDIAASAYARFNNPPRRNPESV